MITEVLLHELHEDKSNDYPADILEVGYIKNIEIALSLTNPVFDISNGTILQLSRDKIVHKAFHGL